MRLWTSLSTSVPSERNPLHLFATESLRARTSQVSLSCVFIIAKTAAAALNEGALRQKIHGDGSYLDHQPACRGQKYVFCDHIVPEYNVIEHGKLLYSDSVIHIVSEMSQRLWHSTIVWRKRESAGCLPVLACLLDIIYCSIPLCLKFNYGLTLSAKARIVA